LTSPAGCAAVSTSSTGVRGNGIDEGNLTIVGPGWSGTLMGGKGGKGGIPANVPIAGGLGGAGGTGFDLHMEGGPGGDILSTGATNFSSVAGGGAVNVRNLPPSSVKGGSVNLSAPLTGSGASGGGAGVGGAGGTAIVLNHLPSGGGYGGAALSGQTSAATAGPNALGVRGAPAPADISALLGDFGFKWFSGGGSSTGGLSVVEAGGGQAAANTSTPATYLPSGAFGGMGGATIANVSGAPPKAGLGGGGASCVNAFDPAISGAGGDGIAVLVLRRV